MPPPHSVSVPRRFSQRLRGLIGRSRTHVAGQTNRKMVPSWRTWSLWMYTAPPARHYVLLPSLSQRHLRHFPHDRFPGYFLFPLHPFPFCHCSVFRPCELSNFVVATTASSPSFSSRPFSVRLSFLFILFPFRFRPFLR